MSFLAGGADGQTPLDPDEAAQLLRSAIATRGELDVVEQENILAGTVWAFQRRRSPQSILTESFVRRLHKKMFGEVWRWAGTYRRTPRNIGVEPWLITQQVGQLLGDAVYWVERSTFEPVELCVRFHHKLVAIHPFPNGNGRHARLAADVLSVSLGGDALGWGRGLQLDRAGIRARYVEALRAADAGEYTPLLVFARA